MHVLGSTQQSSWPRGLCRWGGLARDAVCGAGSGRCRWYAGGGVDAACHAAAENASASDVLTSFAEVTDIRSSEHQSSAR